MNRHRSWTILPPLAALALTILIAMPSQAQTNFRLDISNAPAAPKITLRSTPHWVAVPGTRVSVIRSDERQPFDMFSYGTSYYIYNDGYWYRSSRWDGPFVAIDERNVPNAFMDVPRSNWMNYPSGWSVRTRGTYDNDRDYGRGYDRDMSNVPAAPSVSFNRGPHWYTVPGTRVMMVRRDERPGYDLFSYGSYYYLYNNGYWYQSAEWDGTYESIDVSDVPSAISYVPQSEWVNYPSNWANSNRVYTPSYSSQYVQPTGPQMAWRRHMHWVAVPGTAVMTLREDERPDFDVFRYHGDYYAYANGYWYRTDHWNGVFTLINEGSVPSAFYRVPQYAWVNYPSGWASRARWYDRHYRRRY